MTGFEIDHRRLQFSYWNGIDYNNGNYTKKSYFLDDILDYENAFHDLEKFIYDTDNNVVQYTKYEDGSATENYLITYNSSNKITEL